MKKKTLQKTSEDFIYPNEPIVPCRVYLNWPLKAEMKPSQGRIFCLQKWVTVGKARPINIDSTKL